MTPGARIAAAAEILDRIHEGAATERALLNWSRQSRFAGAKDRAAVRDLVFDVLRCRLSCQAMGGGTSGRAMMIGLLRQRGEPLDELFTGEGHALAPVEPDELARSRVPDPLEELDCPEWLAPQLQQSLGDDFAPVMGMLRRRAPVFLRVNLARGTVGQAEALLAAEKIATTPSPLSPTALEVTGNERRISSCRTYAEGLVELQDAASQAVVDALAIQRGQRVLDYCAGGGGKSLAMAALGAKVDAHDASPARMKDLPERARRAGVAIRCLTGDDLRAGYDLVLLDAPCSGSGSWRRAPQGKWLLTPEGLERLLQLQAQILDAAQHLVRPGGRLAYATCSLLDAENAAQVAAFEARSDWRRLSERRLTPLDGGDGFYVAVMERRV